MANQILGVSKMKKFFAIVVNVLTEKAMRLWDDLPPFWLELDEEQLPRDEQAREKEQRT